jgi:hypothetical protein
MTATQRLHLGAGQHQPGLERVQHLIVEARLAVFRGDLVVRIGLSEALPWLE